MSETVGLGSGIAALCETIEPPVVTYSDVAPQGTPTPYIVYQEIDADSDQWDHLAGPAGIVDSRMQFSTYATTKTEARQVADRINTAFNGYKGTVGGVPIRACRRIGRQAAREDLSDPKLFVVNQDFLITYTEII